MTEATCELADDHVHSRIGSFDADASMLVLCQAACARGLRRLCFTEHLDFDPRLPEYGYYQYDVVHRAFEEACVRYEGKLELALGLEVDFDSAFLPDIVAFVPKLRVDFILGSVHTYQGIHFMQHRAEATGVWTPDELSLLYRHYFTEHRAMLRAGIIDGIAHLDYPAKLGLRQANMPPPGGYDEELAETLTLAAACGVALEINTRRASQGETTAASQDIVQRFVSCGGSLLTLGSDTHRCDQVGDGLNIGLQIIHHAGICGQTIFRQRRPCQPDWGTVPCDHVR